MTVSVSFMRGTANLRAEIPSTGPTDATCAASAQGHTTPGASVARGAAVLLGTQPVSWAASLALVTFLPRYLGDTALGEATVLLTISNLAGAVASLGVPDYLVRHVATRPSRAIGSTGSAFFLLVVGSVAVASVIGAATMVVNPRMPWLSYMLMTMLGVVMNAAQAPLLSLVRGQERHLRYALLNAGSTVSSVGLGLAVLVAGGGLFGYIVSSVASTAIVTAAIMWTARFRPHLSDASLETWKEFFQGGLPFLGTNLTLTIRGQGDRLVLAALTSASTVGWYAAALRIISIPVFVPTLIMTPLLPALSRCTDDRAVFVRTLHRSIEIMLVVIFPCSAALVAIAPSIPQILGWGSSFDKSVPIMTVLALQMVLIGPNMAFGTALVALHRERRWFAGMVGAALVDLSLNLVLIPYFDTVWANGALGAALATLTTEVFIGVVAVAVLPRAMALWRLLPQVARLALISALQVVTMQLTMQFSVLLAVAAGGLVWACGVLVLRVIGMNDLVHAWEMVSRRRVGASRPAAGVA